MQAFQLILLIFSFSFIKVYSSSFFSFYEAKRKQTLAHLPSSSIAGTIFIPQPSYEVKKSSGHLELSVDTLTTTLGPLVWMLGAKTFKNVRKFARVLCLDLHDSNISDQICIKLFVTLQIQQEINLFLKKFSKGHSDMPWEGNNAQNRALQVLNFCFWLF